MTKVRKHGGGDRQNEADREEVAPPIIHTLAEGARRQT